MSVTSSLIALFLPHLIHHFWVSNLLGLDMKIIDFGKEMKILNVEKTNVENDTYRIE